MSLARWTGTVQDAEGNVVPNAQVEVRRESDGGLATIFEDRDGNVQRNNPFPSDANGMAYFHVVGGAYRVTPIGHPAWRYVAVGTAAETDVDELFDAIQQGLDGAVRTDEEQDLSPEAQELGRNNIGINRYVVAQVGEEIAIDQIMDPPPNDGSAGTWIKMSYDDPYNAGVLINESLSGSGDHITATGEVNAPGSPYHEETILLINTTRHFLRPGETAGEKAWDQMQRTTGSLSFGTVGFTVDEGGVFSGTGSAQTRGNTTGSGYPTDIAFDSADSPNARASATTDGETRPSYLTRVYYKKVAA